MPASAILSHRRSFLMDGPAIFTASCRQDSSPMICSFWWGHASRASKKLLRSYTISSDHSLRMRPHSALKKETPRCEKSHSSMKNIGCGIHDRVMEFAAHRTRSLMYEDNFSPRHPPSARSAEMARRKRPSNNLFCYQSPYWNRRRTSPQAVSPTDFCRLLLLHRIFYRESPNANIVILSEHFGGEVRLHQRRFRWKTIASALNFFIG